MKKRQFIFENDLRQLQEKGISREQAEEQLGRFTKGFKPLKILRPAIYNDGIKRLNDNDIIKYTALFERETKKGIKVSRFVPASGAATRMFKDLYDYLSSPESALHRDNHSANQFIELLPRFAFFPLISREMAGIDLDDTASRKANSNLIINTLLNEKGLDYGRLPKGLIHFHRYNNEVRTSMEEHLIESLRYAVNDNGPARTHFTISKEHYDLFLNKLQSIKAVFEKNHGPLPDISFSFQRPSTDTIAVTLQNEPFRDSDGKLLFRPGGHGALISNLNEQDSDIIFIKNIDNVVAEEFLNITVRHKKALAGLLLHLRSRVFSYLSKMETVISDDIIEDAVRFIKSDLFASLPKAFRYKSPEEKAKYLKRYLNRPVRVCGMVRNEGEPGGGPFWIEEETGQESLQILEMSQLDLTDPAQKEILRSATHFNPVDLVCSVYDYKGKKFDLIKFINPETGFITIKSFNSNKIKALELPGLWNGAMFDWITVFAEVPIETFNPVKTINDLLRPKHQPSINP